MVKPVEEMQIGGLEQTVTRAGQLARMRQHEFVTLEHLLLSLIEDPDAVAVLRACNADVDKLREELVTYLENDLTYLTDDLQRDPKTTESVNRTLQRAVIHVQSAGREEVTGANVLVALFSESGSHAVNLLQDQEITRFDAVNYISHGVSKIFPEVLEQGPGPKYFIAESGLIDSAFDSPKYDKAIVTALLPRLIQATQDLISALEGSNAFAGLLKDVQEYLKAIDHPAHKISYTDVWILGVRLQKTADAAERTTVDRMSPELEDHQKKALDFILAIHGPFILATEDGRQLIDASRDYSRTRDEQEQYRSIAEAISQAIQDSPHLASDRVKRQFAVANFKLGEGRHPEREFATSESITKNFMSVMAVAALYVATTAASNLVGGVVAEVEASKDIIGFAVRNLDAAYRFARYATAFLLDNEVILRSLAASCSDSLGWLVQLLSWLKQNASFKK